MGATGIASGDTVYIGAGRYAEVVTVAMTSATVETSIIGDVDGAQTGDAGEVIWTNYTTGWHDTPSASAVLNLAGRDFLTFRNLHLFAGGNAIAVDGATTVHSSDIKLDNCRIDAFGNIAVAVVGSFATALNWTISRCVVANLSASQAFRATLTTGVGADYDANVQLVDSVFWSLSGSNGAVNVINSGTAANRGGGMDVLRCTVIGQAGVIAIAGNLSTTIPCTVGDCLILSGSASINGGTAGQVTDLGGNVVTNSLTNVTAHATTKTTTEDFPAPLLSYAHEWMWGARPRRFLTPMLADTLSRGTIGTATTDMENRARPEGIGLWVDAGTATAGATTTITDGGKAWKTNEHVGRLVRTLAGTGPNQVKKISSNTATVLTVSGVAGTGGVWATTPASGTTYVVYEGPPAETNKATSGSTTTFVVSGANWSVNKWAGYDLVVTAGTNSGVTRSVVSNTSTTLTTAAFGSAIDSTSVADLVWPGSTATAAQRTPGALELHDDARKETVTTDAGGVGIVLNGPGSHIFYLPVDAASTALSVKMRYDAAHGATNKPRALLLANGECGVTAQTVTMTAAADTWETLTFSSFTPTATGVVAVRLESRSDTPYGRCYADTFG